jgi:hypothetical protein
MKLFKDDYSLIFKYYNVSEDSNINLIQNFSCNKPNSSETKGKQVSKPKELYFTIDEIEKGILL